MAIIGTAKMGETHQSYDMRFLVVHDPPRKTHWSFADMFQLWEAGYAQYYELPKEDRTVCWAMPLGIWDAVYKLPSNYAGFEPWEMICRVRPMQICRRCMTAPNPFFLSPHDPELVDP